jgi:exonuclease-1
MQQVSLCRFSGERVAVDGNVWVHKGTYCCALDLASGRPSFGYAHYCRSLTRLLLENGVRPVVVFDGHSLPAKGPERERRRQRRERATADMHAYDDELRELENDAHERGTNANREQAVAVARGTREDMARQAVSVTSEMVEAVMKTLLELDGVEVLRAPYEADAQLAFMARSGAVHAVLTEDSDLLAHACPRVLLKLDRHAATAQLVEHDAVLQLHDPKGFSLRGYDETMLLHMCVLSGVDYLDSPKGLGIKTANKLIQVRHARRLFPRCASFSLSLSLSLSLARLLPAALLRRAARHQAPARPPEQDQGARKPDSRPRNLPIARSPAR